MTTRNIIITPIVLVRAIIMMTGWILKNVGEALWNAGDHVPGWRKN